MGAAKTHPLFKLIHLDRVDDWDELPKLCPNLTDRDHQRLFTSLADSAKTIIVEIGYVDKDYRDMFANFYVKKFADYPSRTTRLHFFRNTLPEDAIWDIARHQDDYIGYSVIQPTRATSIGRTLLDPRRITGIRGRICLTAYTVNILGAELTIKAFPFIGQTTDVTRCAHAACWMLFRYFSEKYPRYAEAWPYEITQMTSNLSHGRLVPSRGITVSQLTEMFSRFGFAPEIYNRKLVKKSFSREEGFYELLFHCIDSGLPVVATLPDKLHAITICGYIANRDESPVDKLTDSYRYVAAFICNDDNHFPYRPIPRSTDASYPQHPHGYTVEDIEAFVVPLYDKIHFPVDAVGKTARDILADPLIGLQAVGCELDIDKVVLRIFLTASNNYRKHWAEISNELANIYRPWPMHQFIWIAELSTPDLIKENKVVGEIIFDATASSFDPRPYTVIHYPGKLFLNMRQHDKWYERKLPSSSPYAAYQLNLAEVN